MKKLIPKSKQILEIEQLIEKLISNNKEINQTNLFDKEVNQNNLLSTDLIHVLKLICNRLNGHEKSIHNLINKTCGLSICK